jgi:hypothetical protein
MAFVAELQDAGPSTTLRFAQDDKFNYFASVGMTKFHWGGMDMGLDATRREFL